MSLAGLAVLAITLLIGCASTRPAPVSERASSGGRGEPSSVSSAAASVDGNSYVVKKGDTLHTIALDHGQSYRDIAAWNNLDDPNKIHVGQQLRVVPPGQSAPSSASAEPVAVAKPISVPGPIETGDGKPARAGPAPAAAAVGTAGSLDTLKRDPKGGKQAYSPEALARLQRPEMALAPALDLKPDAARPAQPERPAEKMPPASVADNAVDWAWPATGKLIGGFVEGSNKGLEIAGKPGEPVLAAAAGKVILVSSALRGYGNFVIIKHNAAFLSVYAHNSRILVKEEQAVSKGQKIAEIGSSDADQPKLHFEIRRQGKPIDPAKFLPVR